MKDYEKHILNELAANEKKGLKTSFCGELVGNQFVFQSIDHAVFNTMQEGRLIPCEKCAKVAIGVLKEYIK